MPVPSMPSIAQIRRPFGGAIFGTVACRLVPMFGGRARFNSTTVALQWTHFIDVPAGTDIRDGLGRSLGLPQPVYGDGDEVRITVAGQTSIFVVAWVTDRFCDTASEYKRVYLIRDEVLWL